MEGRIGMEGRISNLEFHKRFEILDLMTYSIVKDDKRTSKDAYTPDFLVFII